MSKKENQASLGEINQILMVCTGNTCRSPMAAALGRKYLPQVNVISAGVATVDGLPPSVGATEAMLLMGLDISSHCSRAVTPVLLQGSDLVLTMTQRHKEAICHSQPQVAEKVFTLGEFAGIKQEIPDPFGLSAQEYLACAKALDELIKIIAKKITGQEL